MINYGLIGMNKIENHGAKKLRIEKNGVIKYRE